MTKDNSDNKILPKEAEDKGKSKKDKMIKVKASDYEKLAADVADYKDKYMRIFAEFENTRKRYERNKIEFVKYANEGLIEEFLGVVDDVNGFLFPERWIAGTHDNGQVWIDLIDDGTWHHYETLIDPFSYFTPPDSLIRIMAEDFLSSFGVPGDIYFDNILLQRTSPVPVENSTWGHIKSLFQ